MLILCQSYPDRVSDTPYTSALVDTGPAPNAYVIAGTVICTQTSPNNRSRQSNSANFCNALSRSGTHTPAVDSVPRIVTHTSF